MASSSVSSASSCSRACVVSQMGELLVMSVLQGRQGNVGSAVGAAEGGRRGPPRRQNSVEPGSQDTGSTDWGEWPKGSAGCRVHHPAPCCSFAVEPTRYARHAHLHVERCALQP